MNVSLLLLVIIPINLLTLLSAVAIAGGLCFLISGLVRLVRQRVLLTTPTSLIRDAAQGPVEITGLAEGPYTIPAPVSGKPCYLYRITAWQRDGKNRDWEKILDETLHLPFFIADSSGQLLVEPLGAGLDLLPSSSEEYGASLSSTAEAGIPPRVSALLARHEIAPPRRFRIEESLIEPGTVLFVSGTLADNPGIQLRPFSPSSAAVAEGGEQSPQSSFSQSSSPQVIRLSSSPAPATANGMSQQAKIAAALARVGITKPEAWSAAGVPYQNVALAQSKGQHQHGITLGEPFSQASKPESSDASLTPPLVLMRGANDSSFVISYRSQRELVRALPWKSAGMIGAGVAIALLGAYVLLMQMKPA